MKLGSLGYHMRFSNASSARWESAVQVHHIPVETLVIESITAGNLDELRELLSRDVSPNLVINDHPLLYWALSSSQYEIAEFLVESGAHINYLYSDRSALVSRFVEGSDVKSVKFLCDKKVDLEVRNRALRYPLSIAVEMENFDLVKILVDAGANVNIRISNKSLLGWAAEQWFSYGKKTENIVKYLKQAGAVS